MSKWLALMVICLVSFSSCSAEADVQDARDNAAVTDEAASSDASGDGEASEDAAGEDAAGEDGSDFSVLSSLAEIPASAAESDGLSLAMADVHAAAEIANLVVPSDRSDVEQALRYSGALSGRAVSSTPDEREQRVVVQFPTFFHMTAQGLTGANEFGFGVVDMERFVALETQPEYFLVVQGASIPSDLAEVSPDVYTIGDGDDFEVGLENRSDLRNLGRPMRLAERDGWVGLSRSTEPLVEWQQGDVAITLADDEQLRSIAEQLDSFEVVSATINRFDNGRSHDATGLGWSADREGRFGIAVLAYVSPEQAADAFDAVSAGFESVEEWVVVEQMTVLGSTITAKVRFPADSRPQVLMLMDMRNDGPFGS